MKSVLIVMLIFSGVLLSGCVTGKNGTVLDMVGPPEQPAVSSSTNGTLLVYSAYDVNASFNNRDSREQVHSDYEILASDGKPLQRIHNDSGTILQEPVAVELPPGKYRVTAFANGYVKRVMIPVVIEKRQTTVVHLEGGGFWPNESAFNQTNAVRLPDGQIVGWKAATNF